jgi:hypothetical protein
MPGTPQEAEKCRQFVRKMLEESGCLTFDPRMTLWRYTNGNGFLGIMESGAIRATQVAAVNDSTETVYATRLYRDAVTKLQKESTDEGIKQFFQGVLDEIAESPEIPGHTNSKFYISCFSELEDDINQWLKYGGEHGENGYAIGFLALGLTSVNSDSGVVKINYDNQAHATYADKIAKATLDFYLEGLVGDRVNDPAQWANEFFELWDQSIYRLAPTVKDEGFSAEREYRLIHEAQSYDLPFIRYQQKASLLGRYMDIKTGGWEGLRVPRLPIQKIMIGPGWHKGITKRSVEGLLELMGDKNVEVLMSRRALQRP